VLASSTVDHRFEPRSGPAKDYKIGICYFYTKHVALRSKSTDCFSVSYLYKNLAELVGQVQNEHHLIEM